jgi:hypothetical protein
MRLKIKYDKKHGCIHAVTSGIIDIKALNKITPKMGAAVEHYHCQRILHDLRNAQISLETHEIYHTPELIKEAGYSNTRRAFVFASNAQDFTFFETVSSNQGQLVRVFTDINEATTWLLS